MWRSVYDEDVSVTEVTETITRQPLQAKPTADVVDDTAVPDKPAHGVFGNMAGLLKLVDEAVFWKHQHLPTSKISEGCYFGLLGW